MNGSFTNCRIHSTDFIASYILSLESLGTFWKISSIRLSNSTLNSMWISSVTGFEYGSVSLSRTDATSGITSVPRNTMKSPSFCSMETTYGLKKSAESLSSFSRS